MVDIPSFDWANWFWAIGGAESRFWSSAAAAYVATLPKGAGVTPIASEEELWDVLREHCPAGLPDDQRPRRLVPKRIIIDRLHEAGLLAKAKAIIDAADLYTQERWNTRTEIYADDPTALAMLAAIGGDPDVIFAP